MCDMREMFYKVLRLHTTLQHWQYDLDRNICLVTNLESHYFCKLFLQPNQHRQPQIILMCLLVAHNSVKTIKNTLFPHWWDCNCGFIHVHWECLRQLTSMLLLHQIFQIGCKSRRARHLLNAQHRMAGSESPSCNFHGTLNFKSPTRGTTAPRFLRTGDAGTFCEHTWGFLPSQAVPGLFAPGG